MKLQPTEIKRLPTGIAIQWNDGYRSEYSQTLLRQKCPCARCDSLRQGKQPLRILPPDDFFEKLIIFHRVFVMIVSVARNQLTTLPPVLPR